jgi:hypothetical protein
MDRIRYYANFSVKRGCGYFILFVLPFVIGLLPHPLFDLRSAALAMTALWCWLVWSAWRAPYRDYRRRDIWQLLDRWHGLPEYRAHQAISGALRQAFLLYADLAAIIACGLWLALFMAR